MLQQILAKFPKTPRKESLSQGTLQWARGHGVSEQLISTLAECAYEGPIRIGPVSLSRLSELKDDNAEENAECIGHGLLVVGYGLTGDPIAVELASGRMVFVSHDDLWEGSYDEFEDCLVRTPLTFHAFWAAALTSPDFPRDARDAETRWPLGTGSGDTAG